MIGGRGHSRQRFGSTARRYRTSRFVAGPESGNRIEWSELATILAVSLLAVVVVAVIWMLTERAIQDQDTRLRDRVEATLGAQAAILATEVEHELLLIDQSLTVLREAWRQDSSHFQLVEWSRQVPALTAVADDIFIANDHQVIMQDIVPSAVGQGIGSAYVNFPHGTLEIVERGRRTLGNDTAGSGEGGDVIESRQFLMYLIRPLDHPAHYIVGASFRSAALTKLYSQAVLGVNGATALLDLQRGGVQALAGPIARHPRTDVSKTAMYTDMKDRPDGGIWVGPTGMDDVERIHAFRRVPGRDLLVIVSMVQSQAMQPAAAWTVAARIVAAAATLVVIGAAIVIGWTLAHALRTRRRVREAQRARESVEIGRAELDAARGRADLLKDQLAALHLACPDGIAVFDTRLRLTTWNQPFAAASGLPPQELQPDLPLGTLLRRQAEAGLLGEVADIDAEVTRRLSILSGAEPEEALTQAGPDGATLEWRSAQVSDGGLVLVAVRAPEQAILEL